MIALGYLNMNVFILRFQSHGLMKRQTFGGRNNEHLNAEMRTVSTLFQKTAKQIPVWYSGMIIVLFLKCLAFIKTFFVCLN